MTLLNCLFNIDLTLEGSVHENYLIFIFWLVCITLPSSEQVRVTLGGNPHTETHNWKMDSDRKTLEHSAISGESVLIKFFPSKLRDLCGGGCIKVIRMGSRLSRTLRQ